jgi:capsular polysaccharide biosynthesis protein
MNSDFKWGGINFRYLLHYLLRNIWMAIALGVVFFLIGSILSERSVYTIYTAETIVSVTQNQMTPLPENLGNRIGYSNSASAVLNSDAFITQAKEVSGIDDVSVYTETFTDTNLLYVECTSKNPTSAYTFLHYLIVNFHEIAGDVSGDLKISIVQAPELPRKGITVQGSSVPAPILAVAGFFLVTVILCIVYVMPITYKGFGEVFRQYGDDIIQIIPYNNANTAKKPFFRRARTKKNTSLDALRKLTFLLKQTISKDGCKVLLFTSAADNEGKHTICREITSELTAAGLDIFYLDGRIMSILSKNDISADLITHDDDIGCDTIKTAEDEMTFSRQSITALINNLRNEKDAVIICGVPGNETSVLSVWADLSDKAYLIIRENTTDIRKIDALYNSLKFTFKKLGGCILNAFY